MTVEPSCVAGVARTTFSVAGRGEVILCHSDLLGLPAIAAGASAIGTGRDAKQRYATREPFFVSDPQIRIPGERITFRGLLAPLKRAEAEVLERDAGDLCSELCPGSVPLGQSEQTSHHLRVLSGLIDDLAKWDRGADRSRELERIYDAAESNFALVEGHVAVDRGFDDWGAGLRSGLRLFMDQEGWV